MRKGVPLLVALTVAGGLLVVASLALAGGGHGHSWKTKLTGYHEVPAAISTTGKGELRLKLDDDELSFKLEWEGLEGGNPLFAHLHFGEEHVAVAGNVIAFLCGGGGKPACPQASSGEVEGTIVPADVIGPAGQGIAAMEFDELIAAIRAGAVYANLHTPTYPAGEIRGQLRGSDHGGHG